MKHALIRTIIKFFRITRAYRILCPVYRGEGVILGMHRVVPASEKPRIAANSRIEITPEFLEELILFFRGTGYEIISLDQLYERLHGSKGAEKPFVCFTFDDGYADIYRTALPIFEKYDAPFAVYVVTTFADRSAVLWWYMLEDLVLNHDVLDIRIRGRDYSFECAGHDRKEDVFNRIRSVLMELPQTELSSEVKALCAPFGILPEQYVSQLMSWKQVSELARHPLATVGAHTVHHYNLSMLATEDEVEREILDSKRLIENKTGMDVFHFAYPFGSREEVGMREIEVASRCGFHTAVTVREGAIFPGHKRYAEALPRIEITGRHQDITLVDMRRCGTVSLMRNGFNRLVTL